MKCLLKHSITKFTSQAKKNSPLAIQTELPCETCGGSGVPPGTKPETCRRCKGAGMTISQTGPFRIQVTCTQCGGSGEYRCERQYDAELLFCRYLLFSLPSVISLDEWVFNTEAHPLRIVTRVDSTEASNSKQHTSSNIRLLAREGPNIIIYLIIFCIMKLLNVIHFEC